MKIEDICRKSVKEDFRRANFRHNREVKTPHPANTKRIVYVDDSSDYAKYKKRLLGKLVRLKSVAPGGIWAEFVRDEDRKALNDAAGWSDAKKEYLLNGIKFD